MNAEKQTIKREKVGNADLDLRDVMEHRTGTRQASAAATDHAQYLTVADAAGLLGVCERTVYDALRSGRLKGQKFGRVWRVKALWIDEWGVGNRRDLREVSNAL